MNIPECIKLDAKQIQRLKDWYNKFPKLEYDEDCTGASDITFEIFATGLGDNIIAKCFRQKLILSYDDDGEFMD